MAYDLKISDAAANAGVSPIGALLNTGYLDILDGTKPVSVATAISTQVRLARLTFAASAFGSPIAGVITAGAIGPDMDAENSGTATWFRLYASDGTTAHVDGTVGLTGCDLNLNSVTISAGIKVEVTALTLTLPKTA